MSDELFKFVVFKDPKWDFRTLDVAKHLDMARKADGGDDQRDVAEHQAVRRPRREADHLPRLGRHQRPAALVGQLLQQARGDAWREPVSDLACASIMAPGMGHCGGGEGPEHIRHGHALEQWREQGKAPADVDRVADRRREGRAHASAVPVPADPAYKGSGSIDQAAHFECR